MAAMRSASARASRISGWREAWLKRSRSSEFERAAAGAGARLQAVDDPVVELADGERAHVFSPFHAQKPWRNHGRRRPLAAFCRPVAEQPEAAAVVVLDAVVVAHRRDDVGGRDRLPSGRGRHHSSAMRSGPSTRTMRWACRRQMELPRRIVGHAAMTSTGSGRCSSRVGRAPFIDATPCPGAVGRRGRGDGAVVCTRSGRWLSRGSRRTTFSAPSRSASRSARSIVPSSPSGWPRARRLGQRVLRAGPGLDLGRGQDHQLDAEAGIELAELLLEQLHQLRDCRGWAGWCRWRCGRPSRRRGRARSRACARRRPPARTAGRGRRAGGWSRRRCPRAGRSARRRRAACGRRAAGRRGSIGSSSVPSAWSRRVSGWSPKRRASGARGRG